MHAASARDVILYLHAFHGVELNGDTLRQWVHRGHITTRRDRHGRSWYDLHEVVARARERGLIESDLTSG